MGSRRFPRPLRAARNAAYRIAATYTATESLRAELAAATRRIDELGARIETSAERTAVAEQQAQTVAADAQAELRAAMERDRRELLEVLLLLRDDEPQTRRELWRIRETAAYEAAYEESVPLVSVVIPTYTNTSMLIERALPAVRAQTYENLEIVIVGDGAPPATEAAIRAVGDHRIRYTNLPLRGPYPEDRESRWMVAGGPPANEGLRLARGRWIAQMDDDDDYPPQRIEILMREARRRRLEFCYGQVRVHRPGGETALACEFPPSSHHVSLNSSIMHADMRFIAAELGDALFGLVGDWARIRRMMRVGARIGMIDDVVVEYYPSQQWQDVGSRTTPDP